MQKISLSPWGENTIEASITIERPVEKVFEFYRDFKNLPTFLGDVMAIEQSGPATSRWTIQGPLGIRVKWAIRVIEERKNELIRYETVSPPGLKTYWEIYFAPGSRANETEVREAMKAPLGRLGRDMCAGDILLLERRHDHRLADAYLAKGLHRVDLYAKPPRGAKPGLHVWRSRYHPVFHGSKGWQEIENQTYWDFLHA